MARDRSIYWRCFHCGDAFTKAQEKHARDHFGATCDETPVCLMRVPGEYHLLRALRSAQDELAAYRADDTELMRALFCRAPITLSRCDVRKSAVTRTDCATGDL